MPSVRELNSVLYRPTGPKQVRAGIPWTSGGSFSIVQGIDLSLPIRGLRLRFQGRLVIGGADMAAANPEGFLNLISRIRITGTNRRQNGNVTLYDLDAATLWVMQHLFQRSAAYADFNTGGAGAIVRPVPTTPFPAVGANGYVNPAQGTYDFRIIVDLPFHHFDAPPSQRAAFLVRQEEYKDSLQLMLDFGTLTDGAVQCSLGIGQAATTYTMSQFGAAGGTPTIDVESLPMEMGQDLKDKVLPGLLSRTQQPIAGVLQAGGNNVNLIDLQKQMTTRLFLKVGTSLFAPAFATLSDTNVTALGISLGGNRTVRDVLDVFLHKADQQQQYGREPIQGYNVLDFIQSGNQDSAYPGNRIGEGSSFQLLANVAGVANAFGIVVQEQMIYAPDGALYNP